MSESRVRQIRTPGSMSGRWKRGRVGLVRHRQTKEPATDRPDLNYRATSRLYRCDDCLYGLPLTQNPFSLEHFQPFSSLAVGWRTSYKLISIQCLK